MSANLERSGTGAPSLPTNLSNEIASLDKETDIELKRQGRLNLAARLEGRYPEAAGRLYAELAGEERGDDVSRKASSRLAVLQGRGTFGAQAERLVSEIGRNVLDPKFLVPMMAGSVAFSLTRAYAGARLAALGAPWGQGLSGRLLAGGIGFGAEIPTFVILQRQMASTTASWGQDFFHAGLSLGLLKLSAPLFAAPLKRLPSQALLPHAAGGLSLFAVNRLEQSWGLRPANDAWTSLAESFAAYFSLSAGLRAGRSLLGSSFQSWEAGLQWRQPRSPFKPAWNVSWESPLPEAVTASSYVPKEPAGPLLMTAPNGGIGRGRSIPPVKAKELSANYRARFTDTKVEPTARWEALEAYRQLHPQLVGTKHFPDLQKMLLRLVANPGISAKTLEGKGTEERASYYGYQHRIRDTAAELYVQGLEQGGFANPLVERGAQILRKVLENPKIGRAHRPDPRDTESWNYYRNTEALSREKLFPLYTRLLYRLPQGSPEASKGIDMLSRAEWLHRFDNRTEPGDRASPALVGRAYAYLLDAATPGQLKRAREARRHLAKWLPHLEGQTQLGNRDNLWALVMAARHEKPAEIAVAGLESNGRRTEIAELRESLKQRDARRIEDQKTLPERSESQRFLDFLKYHVREWFWFWH
ncbi:MAG TPA: hypothetical protein VJR29_01280 [bacterium]|nr:hypothetical protein [bacterium]